MNTREQDVELLVEQIKNMVSSQPVNAVLDHPDVSFRKVQEAIAYLSNCLAETNEYLKQLVSGNLATPLPNQDNFMTGNLTELHTGLQQLTWQAGEVVKGNYKQKSSFLGEFSNSFNAMIQQLEQRENMLTAQAEELTQSMELMVSIMDKMKDWVIAVDQETGEVIYANRSAKENYYDAENNEFHCQNRGQNPCALIGKLARIRKNHSIEKQLEFTCPSCKRVLRVESNRIRWNDRYTYIYFMEDITHEVGEWEELENMVFLDELTGLSNRRYCMNELNRLVEKRKLFSLCVIDLNQLKVVNDKHGHLMGDEYLRTVADAMKVIVEETEGVVCRVGGDEFIMILPEVEQAQALELMEDLVKNIAEIAKTKAYPMSVSYGIVDVLPCTSTALERILKEADERMYRMKGNLHKGESSAQ